MRHISFIDFSVHADDSIFFGGRHIARWNLGANEFFSLRHHYVMDHCNRRVCLVRP